MNNNEMHKLIFYAFPFEEILLITKRWIKLYSEQRELKLNDRNCQDLLILKMLEQ